MCTSVIVVNDAELKRRSHMRMDGIGDGDN